MGGQYCKATGKSLSELIVISCSALFKSPFVGLPVEASSLACSARSVLFVGFKFVSLTTTSDLLMPTWLSCVSDGFDKAQLFALVILIGLTFVNPTV